MACIQIIWRVHFFIHVIYDRVYATIIITIDEGGGLTL